MLLIDPIASRRATVAGLLQGRRIIGVEPPVPAAALVGTIYALVGTEEPRIDGDHLESTIGALRAAGIHVVCYGAGAGRWAIEVRARLLTWGVHRLLDNGAPGFAAELAGLLDGHAARLDRSRRELASIHEAMGRLGITARSAPMLRVLRLVEHLAHVGDMPVLILGETGTGKELLAQALHHLDQRRRSGPMIAVNCGALPPSLAEAELFGHARGAFSGAERSRLGLVRSAHGGVLLLDEIGELELGLQTRLLRVLQEGRVQPLGEDQDARVDVRLVAATHKDLAGMVRAGTFREDLLHRLSVVPIRVPPLRERSADIPALVEMFLAKHAGLRRFGPAAANDELVEALGRIDLPGNVRQLENLVRRALAEADHADPLGLADLPPEIWQELASRRPRPAVAPPHHDDLNLQRAVARCEEAVLKAALLQAGGSQIAAAHLMGISNRCIYNKIRKYRPGRPSTPAAS